MPKRDIYEGRGRTVGEVKSVWCIMSCCNHFKPLMLNISEENYSIWIDRSKKDLQYAKRHDKLIFLHDNDRPFVAKPMKEILGAHDWDVSFIKRYSFRLPFVSVVAEWPLWSALQIFQRYWNTQMTRTPQESLNFSAAKSMCYSKSGKSCDFQWTILWIECNFFLIEYNSLKTDMHLCYRRSTRLI